MVRCICYLGEATLSLLRAKRWIKNGFPNTALGRCWQHFSPLVRRHVRLSQLHTLARRVPHVGCDCNGAFAADLHGWNALHANFKSAQQYGDAYPWSGNVTWTCVWSIADYSGDAWTRLNAAQADAVAAGGGVLYVPAGNYSLTQNFWLASGVVVRGASTGGAPAHVGPYPGPLSPSSILTCPDRRHIAILSLGTSNTGVVDMALDGCAVMLWPNMTGSGITPANWDMKSYFAYATNVTNQGMNKFVLNTRVRDVSLDDPNVPWHTNTTTNKWPYSYSVAISVYADEAVLVANCLLPAASRAYNTTVTLAPKSTGNSITITTEYMYNNRYGIDVNNMFIRHPCAAACGGDFGFNGTGHTPACCPWSFSRGVVIRDNYVFQNGRVAIEWTGGGDGKTVGSGAQVFNNHVTVRQNTTCWSNDGVHIMTGSDTNENRCYELGGYENNITANTGMCGNQHAAGSPYPTVDGEGILDQLWDSVNGFRNLIRNNNLAVYVDGKQGNTGFISFYNLRFVQDNVLINNTVISTEYIGAEIGSFSKMGINSGNTCSDNTPPCVNMS